MNSWSAKFRSSTRSCARDLCNFKQEKLATLAQICPEGPLHAPVHGKKYGVQWAPIADCDNCWVQVGSLAGLPEGGTCMSYEDHYNSLPTWGENSTLSKPWAKYTMCITDDDDLPHNNASKISQMNTHLEANDRRLEQVLLGSNNRGLQSVEHLRVDDWVANSYMSFWVSVQRSLDMSGILSPLGDFGDFIGGMLPTISVTYQQYVKIPLSGLS